MKYQLKLKYIYQVNLSTYNINSSTQNKLLAFCDYIRAFSANLYNKDAFELGEEIVRTCRIKEALKEENTAENSDRINNIEELVNSLQSFIENEEEAILDEATGEEISNIEVLEPQELEDDNLEVDEISTVDFNTILTVWSNEKERYDKDFKEFWECPSKNYLQQIKYL